MKTIPPEKRIANALNCAADAFYEGDHHKMWVIDQMVRALCGCPISVKNVIGSDGKDYPVTFQDENDEYRMFTAAHRGWDTGMAP